MTGDADTCSHFPLSKAVIDPKVSVFHPVVCGQLTSYTSQSLFDSKCLEDKTIIVVGDSRARQLAADMVAMLEPNYDVKQ